MAIPAPTTPTNSGSSPVRMIQTDNGLINAAHVMRAAVSGVNINMKMVDGTTETLIFASSDEAIKNLAKLQYVLQSSEGGQAVLASTAVALTMSAFAPANGTHNGGTQVTITGTGFVYGMMFCWFNGVPASEFTYVDPTHIKFTSPPGVVGSVDIALGFRSDGNDSIISKAAYTYT